MLFKREWWTINQDPANPITAPDPALP